MRFLLFVPFVAIVAASLAACGGQVSQGVGGGTSSASGSTSNGSTSSGSTSSSSTSNGSTSNGSTSSGSTTSSTSTSSSGALSHGCASNADCPTGATCAPLTPGGGYHVCIAIPAQATMCVPNAPTPQCCTSADCASMGGGSCYPASSLQFCGGALAQDNVCVSDECKADSDCAQTSAPAICAPAGAFNSPNRVCLTAYCKVDGDCKAKAGGACVLVGTNPCCKNPSPDGLGCVYPGACATDADCPMSETCHLQSPGGESGCNTGSIGCPG